LFGHVEGMRLSPRALVSFVVVFALWWWVFGGVLLTREGLAYRDVAHFYFPLFEYVQQQWNAGRWPLWNPLEGLGKPLLADGTASPFYPLKLVFALPGEYAWWFHVYVSVHVLLCAFGAYRLARVWVQDASAAGVGALAYAFGGSVLFQYANPPFLVGAAWLPWCLLAVQSIYRCPSRRAVVGMATTLALMVLGGDPQGAYHAVLLALLPSVVRGRWGSPRNETTTQPPEITVPYPARRGVADFVRRPVVSVVVAAALAGGLAAVQILPSAVFARRSSRAVVDAPRSVYQLASYAIAAPEERGDGPWYAGLLELERRPGSHDAQRYWFSVGPWRWIEMLWPNFAGRQFPVHGRWFDIVPAEGELWTPSLYFGVLPLLAALGAVWLRRGAREVRWMACIAAIGLLAAMGGFGLGWIGQGSDPPIGDAVGGLYWWMVTLLPGYATFRYPAKWLVPAALGLSMLAAVGCDEALSGGWRKRTIRALAIFASVIVVTMWIGVLIFNWAPAWWGQSSADPLFGPLDASRAAFDVFTGAVLASTVLVLICCGFLFCNLQFTKQRLVNTRLIGALMLSVTALDLAVANSWLIGTAPLAAWNEPQPLAARLADDTSPARPRAYRATDWFPEMWHEESSEGRLEEIVRWQRQTLYPKFHLPAGVALVQPTGSLVSADFAAWLAGDCAGELSLKQRLALLGVERLIVSDGSREGEVIAKPVDDPLPRVWTVRDVEQLPPLDTNLLAAIERRTAYVLAPSGEPRDLRRQAVVETPVVLPTASNTEVADMRNSPPRIVSHETNRMEVDVALNAPVLLVVNEAYDPGWRARVCTAGDDDSRSVPVLQTNRVMRGVWLPAGEHRVEFVYRPTSFYAGLVISLATAAILLLTLLRRVWRESVARARA